MPSNDFGVDKSLIENNVHASYYKGSGKQSIKKPKNQDKLSSDKCIMDSLPSDRCNISSDDQCLQESSINELPRA